jgi:hypothetical protein
MKDPLARQAQLNAALDLDKNETQLAPPAEDDIGFGDVSRLQQSLRGSSGIPRRGWVLQVSNFEQTFHRPESFNRSSSFKSLKTHSGIAGLMGAGAEISGERSR